MLDAGLLPLQNDRARVRALRLDDAGAFAEGTDDPQVRTYGHLPEPDYTPASAATMIEAEARPGLERGDLAVLAIAEPATDDFAGSLVIFDVADDTAEVGFWVHPRYRGSGMAAAALDLAGRFARGSGLSRLTARTAPANLASQRVLTRSGFTETDRRTDIAPSGQEVELISYQRTLDLELPRRTERLRLRRHRPDDGPSLHRIYSRPEIARYLLDEPWTEDDATQQVHDRHSKTDLDGAAGALALIIEHDDQPIGDVLMWSTDRERRVAEIGWVLDPDHGGRGLATEAVRAVLDLAFGHYRLHRVAAQMDARNAASITLAGRVGMHHEAHLRQDWWNKGEWTDTVVFGLLASDR